MLRFSLFGIPITVQPWFWVTLAFLGNALNIRSSDDLLQVALFIIAGFVSILVHELGHALTGKSFGAPTQITLIAFGGYAAFPANAFSRKQDFVVTAAGPFVQAVLGGVMLVALIFIPGLPPLIQSFLGSLVLISLFWAVLNLVPVIPLDGGRLMAAILGPARRHLCLKISMIAAIVIGLLMLQQTGSFLFPVFLGFMAYQNWQELQHYRR